MGFLTNGLSTSSTVTPLAKIVKRNQIWSRMAAEHGVDNRVPTVADKARVHCDALDRSGCGPEVLSLVDRGAEQDAFSATVYADLPYPENRLVSPAHSLVARGVIDEAALEAHGGG
uniref:Uncharacterized protein n=1 Tax=Mycobacterium riyadhense TaxID=486698 RepID=A0A653EU10_9MYCO|nr:hypothetical protein BIN_B_03757 [Mycobacterium riyadhense]